MDVFRAHVVLPALGAVLKSYGEFLGPVYQAGPFPGNEVNPPKNRQIQQRTWQISF
jgi:hypothetical protein